MVIDMAHPKWYRILRTKWLTNDINVVLTRDAAINIAYYVQFNAGS
jgi:hypothetical protein